MSARVLAFTPAAVRSVSRMPARTTGIDRQQPDAYARLTQSAAWLMAHYPTALEGLAEYADRLTHRLKVAP